MLGNIDISLIEWSRAQFAMTAIYHWLFVPLTLGLAVIMGIMETIYYRTGDEKWKRTSKFWMKLFGINFSIGVATGLIMEFEFGTNWSNYSWFVGDIFGAPLAIEGILAFFMESTFIAVMFFGWNKVGRGMHLASTWLTGIGATLSALWILVANAWMQYPVGMEFNPDTARNEMVNFWDVALSPMAINKFWHTILSSWIVGAVFVVGVSCWYLYKNREVCMAKHSIKIAAWVGLFAALMTALTGDGSGYQVAQKQPMKLAAMEGLYKGDKEVGLVAFGLLNPEKKTFDDGKDAFTMRFDVPYMLSLLANHDAKSFVPGVEDIIKGGYTMPNGETALSAEEKIERGRTAITAFANYKKAKSEGDEEKAKVERKVLDENMQYFGYGYIRDVNHLVPNIPLVFYMFRVMVMLGGYFIVFFIFIIFLAYKKDLAGMRWVHWMAMLTIPLAYLASQAGWAVAECGRQPWTIQDMLPDVAAVSNLSVSSVKTTFAIFLVIFTTLLIAEIGIMCAAIRKGPETENN